jgi:hypothetical protein
MNQSGSIPNQTQSHVLLRDQQVHELRVLSQPQLAHLVLQLLTFCHSKA